MSDPKNLPAADAVAFIQRAMTTQSRDLRVCIRAYNPGGLTAHQTVEVDSIHCGFDWDAGKIILQPGKPLTWLRPDDVEAVHKSAKEGQSWHAYQREKNHLEQISEALGVKVSTFPTALREMRKLKAASASGSPEESPDTPGRAPGTST